MTQEELNAMKIVRDAGSRGVITEIEGSKAVITDEANYTLLQSQVRVPVEQVEETLQGALNNPYWPYGGN